MAHFRTLFKNRTFVLYSIGQAFSQFGDRLVQIVLIGFVYKRWPGSTLQLAKIFLFTVLPSFVISPIAGVYIDRWNKKYVMIASDIFRAVIILFIPFFFIYRESVIPVYAIIFLIFTSACFFLPARLSIIPAIVPKEDILLANSASAITWVIAGITGFGLGGIMVEWIGVKSSLYINSAVYILAALSFLFLAYSIKTKALVKKSFFHDLRIGLRTLLRDNRMKFMALIFFIFASVLGASYVVLIVFIQETMATMTKYIGIFGICIFVGMLGGSYTYGKIGHGLSRIKTIFMSLFFIGIFLGVFVIGLKAMNSFWLGGIAAFLLGISISPVYAAANTIVHEAIEHHLRGRIFSSLGIIMNIGFLLFMFVSSILAEHIDRFWILIACGSVFAFIGLIGFLGTLAGFIKDFTFSS